jgi:hypothetical protein
MQSVALQPEPATDTGGLAKTATLVKAAQSVLRGIHFTIWVPNQPLPGLAPEIGQPISTETKRNGDSTFPAWKRRLPALGIREMLIQSVDDARAFYCERRALSLQFGKITLYFLFCREKNWLQTASTASISH